MHLFDECPSCDAEVALPFQSGTHHWMVRCLVYNLALVQICVLLIWVVWCLQMTLKDLVDISLLRLQQFMLVLECYPLEEGLYEAYTPELPLYSQCCGYVTFAEGREKIKVFNYVHANTTRCSMPHKCGVAFSYASGCIGVMGEG